MIVLFQIAGVLLFHWSYLTSADPQALFPLQFSANIEITAHLIEENSEYPPRKRRLRVYYDYIQKLARADIEEGYEAAKTYIRRYDLKNEYMVRYPPIDDCKRSYLGDIMPFPDIPISQFIGVEHIADIMTNHFLYVDGTARIHVYIAHDGAPVRLIQETYENNESIPMLTYDYSNVVLKPQDKSLFDIPGSFSHNSCEKQAGGFPYLHIFHYFVRF
mmetsp:Transcript_34430/g.35100  ORF Transcript_34430/g.35100 Transcript_34430/m.35100 type:complete len:217 (+) Transcript_34430:221-871(+)